MLRFVARRIPRFRLSTLFASMLLFVTLAGAWRQGRSPEARENDALLALQDEGLRYRAYRASGDFAHGITRESLFSNPIERLANWSAGNADPLESVHIQGWPSDATRAKLLDLPHLETLQLRPPDVPAPGYGENAIPRPDAMLGRRLPHLPAAKPVADQPPPLPKGTPLSEQERIAAAGDIIAQWSQAPEFPAKKFLCHAYHADVDDYTYVIAMDGSSSWWTIHAQGPREVGAFSELCTDSCFVRRARNANGWQMQTASRDPESYRSNLDYTLPLQAPYLDWTMERFFEGDFDTLYESAERLDDGALLLRMRPRAVSAYSAHSGACELVRGALIVDPAHDFAVRRIEADVEGESPQGTISLCQIFDYETNDGLYLPVRCQSWIELPPTTLTGAGYGGKRGYELLYAWEIDPELPADLFSPTRGGEEFLTPQSRTAFHWWYVTGAISLAWFYLIASDRVRQRFRRVKKSKLVGDDPSIPAAEGIDA